MNNLSNEAINVLKAIREYGPIRASQLMGLLDLSAKTIHKHLAKLVDEQLVTKVGQTPKVFYKENVVVENDVDENLIIDRNYVYVSPSGEIVYGVKGFGLWCDKNKFNYDNESMEYIGRIRQMGKLKRNGLIGAKKRILSGKTEVVLSNIYFSDFYTLDHFGKTKLGQLVYVGKSSQNKDLIREVGRIVKPAIEKLIEAKNIQMVCYVPPTIDRKIQFVEMLKNYLKLNLPNLEVVKIPMVTKVAQKTLRKLEDRIVNAKSTMAVDPRIKILGNVLIIDDATGSGATMNEIAKKILLINKEVKVYGYSVVGSYKGFDVISEV